LPIGAWGENPTAIKRLGRTEEQKAMDEGKRESANFIGHVKAAASIQEQEYWDTALVNGLENKLGFAKRSKEVDKSEAKFKAMVLEITSNEEYKKKSIKTIEKMNKKIDKIKAKMYKKAKKIYGKKWAKCMFGKLVDKKTDELIKAMSEIKEDNKIESRPPAISPSDLDFSGFPKNELKREDPFNEKKMAEVILDSAFRGNENLPVGSISDCCELNPKKLGKDESKFKKELASNMFGRQMPLPPPNKAKWTPEKTEKVEKGQKTKKDINIEKQELIQHIVNKIKKSEDL